MAKLIFRIIHILFLVVGVVLVTSITDAKFRQNAILEYSHDLYDDDDLSFMIDGNYVKNTPIAEEEVNQEGRTFNIYVYDVVTAINTETDTTFKDGFQIIIEQLTGDPMPYATDISFSGTDYELTIPGMQYYDLPLYVTYDQDNGKLKVTRDELGTNTIDTITVTGVDGTYMSLNVDIDITDLTAMDQINTYLSTHEVLNTDDINDLSTIEFLQVDTIPVIIRNLVIYIIIATIVSAGIIFYQKRHMGRGKVNPRLREDLNKIKRK